MAVTLSAGIRNALTSLQGITSQSTAVQNRLSTGKKVNTAVDNPVNYFTAASLNDRSSQLTGLLDGISNGIQTVQAASKGIDGITKLVGSLQSTIKQAQADAAQNRPTITSEALATAAEKVEANKSFKDIALDKSILDIDTGVPADDGAATTATATRSGDLGIADTNTFFAIEIQVGDGDPANGGSTYVASFSGANATVRDVVNEINKSGVATAFVDEKGQLNIKGTGSQDITFSFGAAATAVGVVDANGDFVAGADQTDALLNSQGGTIANTATPDNITSSVRSNLIQQYNDLRTQIDELAKDSGFNGLNLLQGDRLTITFNEKGGKNQSKMEIQGSTLSAENLGILEAGNINGDITSTNFQDDTALANASESLSGALTSLKSLSSTFGANLSVAQTRQDFTKDMANVLTIGADNLVNADANEEAAALLSLQTRQQLSQTALSLSSQADQGVLRLF